jgi:hypothetical protein
MGAPTSSFAFAAISAGCAVGDSTTGGAVGVAGSGFSWTGEATAAAGVAALGAGGFTTTGACVCSVGFGVVAVAAAGGLATAGGGTTVTIGRAGAAPAGAFATTVPAGGFEAIAGGAGGMIAGACRGCGTIFLGSGRAGVKGGAATDTTGGAGLAGALGAAVVTTRGGNWLLRASASCSCFLARMAFMTSPGLDTWERSILGVIVWEARDVAAAEWLPWRPCWKCARTLSASWSSIELE